MNRAVFAVVCLVSSMALATSVTLIQPTALPANAPTVTFEGAASGNTYTESGLTLTAPSLYFYAYGGSQVVSPGIGGQGALFSFSSNVSQVTFTEFFFPTTSVTLFSDAAGTQSLGTFATTHAYSFGTARPFAFQSDTPFRSFSVTVTPAATYWVDDLRYSTVPEPTAIAAVGLIVAAAGLRRKRD